MELYDGHGRCRAGGERARGGEQALCGSSSQVANRRAGAAAQKSVNEWSRDSCLTLSAYRDLRPPTPVLTMPIKPYIPQKLAGYEDQRELMRVLRDVLLGEFFQWLN